MFLLPRDKFIPEMHLIFLGIACGTFITNKKRIQKFKEEESIEILMIIGSIENMLLL